MRPQSLIVDNIELSPCELDLLPLQAEGLPRKLIADKLGKSLSTIDSQLRILYVKLNIHKDKELVAWVIRKELDTEKKIKEALRKQRKEGKGN